MVVKWSISAKKELQNIVDYIEDDSPQNARAVAFKIFEATFELPQNPLKYPVDKQKKINDGSYRAFELSSFRISYRIFPKSIYIIRVRHVKRSSLDY